MSRVAKNPVVVPAGVEVKIDAGQIVVKGPLGSLAQALHPSVKVEHGEAGIQCSAIAGAVNGAAMSGTLRALVNNMVTGVSKGFERKLNLVGVGYRAQAQGDKLNLSLGFSHPVVHQMPVGIKVETPTQTEIVIKGVDKQAVGKVAAEVRAYRAPEPYKGKGVRYSDEVVTLKETKKK
ncbi:MAG: 50S ribosomal protein L6 [Zoogloea sp.]|uniref:50S ribosomal protein L6 n=1 Tax=Zoogloea sp. TaxID=49181 RepID=UPI002632FE4E|nr:50S ribosomal protein L6 [Zoogloea sp.]MDD3327500.1 50S ribosomal protein L6 [Zoogloea sp.]